MYQLEKPQMLMPSGEVLTSESAIEQFRGQIMDAGGERATGETFMGGDVQRLTFDDDQAKGTLDFIKISDDVFVFINQATFEENLPFKFMDSTWTRFHFRLDANTTMLFEERGQLDLKGPVCSVLQTPEGMVEAEWYNSSAPEGWITVLCSRRYLLQLLSNDIGHLPLALRRYLDGGEPEWFFDAFRLTAPMARCLLDIPRVPYTTPIGKIHLEAKVVELVCIFLYSLCEEKPGEMLPVLLRDRDVEAIHEARSILLERIADPLNVNQLSRTLGINRKKLSYGFKHVFQQTISDFLYQSRMQHAQDLLLDGSLSIEMVAQSVGYDHAGNFSTAFKRCYGVSPTQLKK